MLIDIRTPHATGTLGAVRWLRTSIRCPVVSVVTTDRSTAVASCSSAKVARP